MKINIFCLSVILVIVVVAGSKPKWHFKMYDVFDGSSSRSMTAVFDVMENEWFFQWGLVQENFSVVSLSQLETTSNKMSVN